LLNTIEITEPIRDYYSAEQKKVES